jgi:hypothetical protein
MPKVTPAELRSVAEELQQKGILDLQRPASQFIALERLGDIKSLSLDDPSTTAAWYVIGGSGYVAVCD